MSSRFDLRGWLSRPGAPRAEVALLCVPLAVLAITAAALPGREPLRVCADPNNLPFSDARRAGFENRIVELIARDLDRPVSYTWWPQRRGFIRHTLNAGACDLVAGIPTAFELARPTDAYYRSTYVFATRRDDTLQVRSLDDPALRHARIGVHLIGDDYANSPAAQSLSRRGLGARIVGFSIYGDYSRPTPTADLMRALADHRVDVAIVWGPIAGWFARSSPVPLRLEPVQPQMDLPFIPYVFDIGMGVRRSDTVMYDLINDALRRREPEIRRILEDYGVPLLPARTLADAGRNGS